MSTCQTEIVKVPGGYSLNLFNVKCDGERFNPDYVKEVLERHKGFPLIIRSDIGQLDLGFIGNVQTGMWGSEGNVKYVTGAFFIKENPVMEYLHKKGVRISGSVFLKGGSMKFLTYLDQCVNLDNPYNLNEIGKE